MNIFDVGNLRSRVGHYFRLHRSSTGNDVRILENDVADGTMQLERATLDDADVLLEWRNDPETRNASHHMGEVQGSTHRFWLMRTLSNADRQLYIAKEKGVPVGTVRADFFDGVYELSWTVAPSARGRGVAKRMVDLLAARLEGPIRAEVKAGNSASMRIAEHAGMRLDREIGGVLHYSRPGWRRSAKA